MNYKLNRILLSPDEVASADPLDTNVNDVDTSYPILPAASYSFKLDGCKVQRNKANTGDILVVPHKLNEKTQDRKGNDVFPGLTIIHRVSITETPEYTTENIKKNVARLGKAANVSATVRQIMNSPSLLDGKIVQAKVKVNKETSEFPESNGIAGYDVKD